MKDMFPEYYTPSDNDFAALWRDAIFVFDANVLLNIYRFSPKTSQELIEVIKGLNDRVWLPHQFAYEYHVHKIEYQSSPPSEYNILKKWLEKKRDDFIDILRQELPNQLSNLRRRTDLQMSGDEWFDNLINTFNQLIEKIDAHYSEHQEWLNNQNLSDAIADLFNNKVGAKYSPTDLAQKHKLAKERYEQKIPPGYADSSKKQNQYGDVVAWFQIIDHAKQEKHPIILVTSDGKDDWLLRVHGESKGPRAELIREMRDEANVSFYLYPTAIFLSHAREYLKSKVSDAAIEEVRTVDQQLSKSEREVGKLTRNLKKYSNSLEELGVLPPRTLLGTVVSNYRALEELGVLPPRTLLGTAVSNYRALEELGVLPQDTFLDTVVSNYRALEKLGGLSHPIDELGALPRPFYDETLSDYESPSDDED